MEEQPVIPQGGSTTLSVEEPMVPAEATATVPPMPPLGGDSSSDPARLLDGAVDTLDEEDSILLGDGEDVFDLDTTGSSHHRAVIFGLPAFGRRRRTIQEVLTDAYNNDVDAYVSSDSEMEGNDGQVRSTDIVSQTLTFLGQPARFASYKGFVGFMRLDTKEVPPAPGQEDAGAIVVHFCCYRFSKTRGGGEHGVEAPDCGTDVHHIRYLVPFPAIAADPASSLRLAGASLAAEPYPRRRRRRSYVRQLQALWSGLVAAAPVRVPPRATLLVVTVDVGALRRQDRTPELVECMRSALEEKARDADASPPVICGQEQHLPAPVCCGDDAEESSGEVVAPAAKRKRLDDVAVAAEVCAICREVMMLEQGLAAWPRCSHAFHGKCLEELLATAPHRCPMCRSKLSVTGMFD